MQPLTTNALEWLTRARFRWPETTISAAKLTGKNVFWYDHPEYKILHKLSNMPINSFQEPKPFRFDEVGQAPNESGIYAWYHQIQISTADVQALIVTMASQATDERTETARTFLVEHIFRPYQEADYEVALSGGLKPEYRGKVKHRPRLSDLLVNLVAEQPHDIVNLKQILQGIIPYFASPIYIGVATKSLRQRLTSHQHLISYYRELEPTEPLNPEDEDHSFAFEAICVRHLVPTELLVYAMPLGVSDKLAKGAEYILNRINYPLCGRN